MDSQHEFALIIAVLEAGNAEALRKAKITPEFLLHPVARQMLKVIYEYGNAPSTMGKAPALEYLNTLGLHIPQDMDIPKVHNLEGVCAAFVLARVRQLLMKQLDSIVGTASTNPLLAYQRVQELASNSEIALLTTEGEGGAFSTGFGDALDRYKATAQLSGVVGLETPFPTLTAGTRGWRKGGLYVLFAPPKSYKTWVALQCVASLFLAGRRVMIISTEMTQDELDDRLLCLVAKVDYNQFLSGALDGQTLLKLDAMRVKIAARLTSDIIHWRPVGMGAAAIAEVRAKIKEHNHDGQLALVLWDGHYRSARSTEWTDVGDLTRATKTITIDKTCGEVPILLTTQEGSKVGETSYKVYEQEANAVFRLSKVKPGVVHLTTLMIREGRSCFIELKIDFTTSTIIEVKGMLEDVQNSAPAAAGSPL